MECGVAWKTEAGARTDTGRVRHSNQDSFGMDEERGLYLVCDGMGGAAGGQVASALAVETFLSIARQELECVSCDPMELTPRSLRRAVAGANRAVVERARWEMGLRGMGTTLVGMRVEEGRATVVHVGDSRAYLVHGGSAVRGGSAVGGVVAERLTEDHSYVAERVKLGLMGEGEAAASPMRSVITRAIGADVDVRPDVRTVRLEAGDVLLLASDGLTRHVEDEEIAGVLGGGIGAEEGCGVLVGMAVERGGVDNVTCLAVKVVRV